jgi:hypothetical protein
MSVIYSSTLKTKSQKICFHISFKHSKVLDCLLPQDSAYLSSSNKLIQSNTTIYYAKGDQGWLHVSASI